MSALMAGQGGKASEPRLARIRLLLLFLPGVLDVLDRLKNVPAPSESLSYVLLLREDKYRENSVIMPPESPVRVPAVC